MAWRHQDPFTRFEKEFEKGWTEFIKGLQKENNSKNERLFKALTAVKGERFVSQLREMLEHIGCNHSLLHVVRQPVGMAINERRFSEISEIWVDQKSTLEGYFGSVCVQVKPERWVKVSYSIERPSKQKLNLHENQ